MANAKEEPLNDEWEDGGGEEIAIPEEDEFADLVDNDFAAGYTKLRRTWDFD